jgi:uncharacterized protein YydD (DUF2326 family)
MFPRSPASIVFEQNTGDNQVRYKLGVQIEGDDSDGINAARILCFDWTLLLNDANHTVDFLWHDNRLFADLDPHARAEWMLHFIASLDTTNKLYIATFNTENFASMRDFLDEKTKRSRWTRL